ncbi:fimbrin [Mitosporidium daphniae]
MTTTKLDRSSENRIRSVRESAARFDTCTSSICTPPSMVKKIHGSAEGITHSIDEDEVNQFSSNINEVLGSDMHLSHLLPLALDGSSLFEACKDGLLLCKLLNSVAPLTIDDRVLNYHQPCMPLSLFHKTENINVAVQSAKSLGCSTVNIGPQDILEGRPHLILGLVSLQCHPELFRLLGEGEEIEDLLRLPPEKLLLRWDGEIYIRLLNRLSPDSMQLESTLREDIQARALAIVAAAACMGCKHYITPKAITTGNARLNMAFMASLFNKWPGLAPLDVEKQREVTILVEETQGDREARALVMWMNSLGVEPAVSTSYGIYVTAVFYCRRWQSFIRENHPLAL